MPNSAFNNSISIINFRGGRGSSGVWMTKRRKYDDEKQNEKWLDPSVTDQVGGNAGENWW